MKPMEIFIEEKMPTEKSEQQKKNRQG